MMKKIAIIIPSIKFWWGAENMATTIGTKLSKKYAITFFTFYDHKEQYPYEGSYVSLREKENKNIVWKCIKLFTRARKIAHFCKKNNIDTCLSFMEDANFSTIISGIFGNKANKIICIRHSLSAYGRWLYTMLIKLLYKYANKIVVMTEYEKQHLTKRLGIKKDRINIIYNLSNKEKIESQKNEELGAYKDIFNEHTFTFISTGRLSKIKNQELLIHAFNSFHNKHSASQLLLLGDGELRDKLKNIANNKDVHFLGNQPNVYKFLDKADCFILTSFSEAFPNAILEAMACKLPILSSDTQGWREIIGNNEYGIIFENNNEKDLLNHMEEIYTNAEIRKNYTEKSGQRAKDFEMDGIIRQREAILENESNKKN